MQLVDLSKDLIVLNTRNQVFSIKDIGNRRFMFSSKHKQLVLGDERKARNISGSHAEEFHLSEADGMFDDYIRGWIGRNNGVYKNGIVHFAPHICPKTLDEGIKFMNYLVKVMGINGKTMIRGIQNIKEEPLNVLLPGMLVDDNY